MTTEKTYRLELTLKQLRIIKSDLHAVAEPAHRTPAELALIELVERAYSRASKRERLRGA